MTFNVMYTNGKLHIDRKNFVANSEVWHEYGILRPGPLNFI